MQSQWRVVVMCVRGTLRGALARYGACRKLSVAALLCVLCLVVYYHHVGTSTGNTNYLVAVTNLQSFSEVSRQYSEQQSAGISSHVPLIFRPALNASVVVKKDVVSAVISALTSPTTNTDHEQVLTTTSKAVVSSSLPKTVNKPISNLHRANSASQSKRNTHYIPSSRVPQVLLLYGTDAYKQSVQVRIFLESYRIAFKHTSLTKGRYLITGNGSSAVKLDNLALVIVVANVHASLVGPYMEYCQLKKLPIIWAVIPMSDQSEMAAPMLPRLEMTTLKSDAILHVGFSKTYPFYYARPGTPTTPSAVTVPSGRDWTAFAVKTSDDSHVTSLDLNSKSAPTTAPNTDTGAVSHKESVADPSTSDVTNNYRTMVEVGFLSDRFGDAEYVQEASVIEDLGLFDGVRKIVIGSPLKFWLSHLVLLDAVRVLCEGVTLVRGGRERMVMVDIDDVFLAPEGTRMTPDDVQAMLEAQTQLRRLVDGFTFNAGFVGGYYDIGPESEILGNQELVRNADQLWWFSHTFRHHQPHQMTLSSIRASMEHNLRFAKEHNIAGSVHHYSVAPHHSGVYPVHTPLYDAWKEIWNVSVTTTEEYPSLRPDHRRRGFIHRGLRVLPRQTCRLFTHTYLTSHFPGGRKEVVAIAEGGEVFMTLLRNPVSVFMTHMGNYCCDRLALLLFSSLFTFTSHWTQLHLTTPTPEEMADHYFHLFPEDEMPLWTSPCDDKRHLDIWPSGRNCSHLPSLLVLGPQKSGTTALHTFLKLHPHVISNRATELHYEEIQFFSDDTLYQQGIDWYMDQFPYPPSFPPSDTSPTSLSTSPTSPSSPSPSSPTTSSPPSPSSSVITFEKSAAYLTHPLAPLRAHSLLPRAKLVVILADPAMRAHSWYQHQRAHSDPTALQYSFSEVLHASSHSPSTPPTLTALSRHCLTPAHYHHHITQWLTYYDKKQLLLLDGDELVERPADVMDTVQKFLNIPHITYHDILQYDSQKGFYCTVDSHGKRKCLGKSKGRSYPSMTAEEQQWLTTYYTTHNTQLRRLLSQLGVTPPGWLINTAITNT